MQAGAWAGASPIPLRIYTRGHNSGGMGSIPAHNGCSLKSGSGQECKVEASPADDGFHGDKQATAPASHHTKGFSLPKPRSPTDGYWPSPRIKACERTGKRHLAVPGLVVWECYMEHRKDPKLQLEMMEHFSLHAALAEIGNGLRMIRDTVFLTVIGLRSTPPPFFSPGNNSFPSPPEKQQWLAWLQGCPNHQLTLAKKLPWVISWLSCSLAWKLKMNSSLSSPSQFPHNIDPSTRNTAPTGSSNRSA